jgi:hypothetical protein
MLAVAMVAAGSLAGTASASTTQEAILQDDAALHSNPLGTLMQMRSLGVTRVRVGVYWANIAPGSHSTRRPAHFTATDPAAYPARNWGIYDTIVRDAQLEGINVYFVVVGPAPRWANGSGIPRGGLAGPWKPSAKEFGSFVTALGTRYSGSYSALPKVSFWSIWNEPNYGIDLAPQATNHDNVEVGAAQYRGLVDAAWTALHRTGHAGDTFLFGETAPHGYDHPIGNYNVMRPLRFIRALFCLDSHYHAFRGSAARARGCPSTAAASRRFRAQHPGLFSASGFAAHPYAQRTPPNRSLQTNHTNRDNADLAEIGQLARTLDRSVGAYGSRSHLPIWNTEDGYQTNPPEQGALSPTTAAYYMNWAEYISWRNPRIRSWMQYELLDPPGGNFASGLEFRTGQPKQPVYNAYRLPLYLPHTSGKRGQGLEVWGDVRPARYGLSLLPASIQFQPGSKGAWQTVRQFNVVPSRTYFDVRQAFSGSGSVRLVWNGAVSRTVAISLH